MSDVKAATHVSGTTRGEDVKEKDGLEAGRSDAGTSDTPAQRPYGTSTARDMSGIDPQDPIVAGEAKAATHVAGTTRGEDVKRQDGIEAGRSDSGTSDTPAQRPYGTSTARDMSGIDPQDPINPDSPTNG
ncbi:MAG: hypothetical protein NVSMB32_12660 [Actinomycetota bacterium]